MLDVGGTKALVLVLMVVLTLLVALLPLYLHRRLLQKMHEARSQMVLTGCLCFGAGVLLSIVFLHLLPETRLNLEYAMEEGYMATTTYPVAEVTVIAGFFLVYFIEEVIHTWIGNGSNLREADVSHEGPTSYDEARRQALAKRVYTNHSVSEVSYAGRVGVGRTSLSLVMGMGDYHTGVAEEMRHSVHTIPHCHHQAAHDDTSLMSTIVVVTALSFHSVMEGLALGLEDSVLDIWFLFTALCAHKLVIAFSMSMELLEVGVSLRTFLVSVIVFSLASPLGGIIGILVTTFSLEESAGGVLVPALLEALAGGTILYVTFCEVLERERSKESWGWVRFVALLLGFGIMAGLESVGGHEHGHSHPEDTTTTVTTAALWVFP